VCVEPDEEFIVRKHAGVLDDQNDQMSFEQRTTMAYNGNNVSQFLPKNRLSTGHEAQPKVR
jgi:hypothetical protein